MGNFFAAAGKTATVPIQAGGKPMHRFRVGQLVRLTSGTDRSSGSYKVLRLLPETHGEFHYRIKGVHNQTERAVRETEIAAAG
jgi:hypothetical protein